METFGCNSLLLLIAFEKVRKILVLLVLFFDIRLDSKSLSVFTFHQTVCSFICFLIGFGVFIAIIFGYFWLENSFYLGLDLKQYFSRSFENILVSAFASDSIVITFSNFIFFLCNAERGNIMCIQP